MDDLIVKSDDLMSEKFPHADLWSLPGKDVGRFCKRQICQICNSPLIRARRTGNGVDILRVRCEYGHISYFEEV